MSERASDYYYRLIEARLQELTRVAEATRSELKEGLRELIKILEATRGELKEELSLTRATLERTRVDLAARLYLVSTVLGILDYISVKSRLTALRDIEDKLRAGLEEAKAVYREKIREIMRDYMSAVSGFFSHFLARARGDFDLIRSVLAREKAVEDVYELFKPESVDSEVVALALRHDTAARAEDVSRALKLLAEASGVLERASTLERGLREKLGKFEVEVPAEGVVMLPVLGVLVALDGTVLSEVRGPSESWEKVAPLSLRVAEYAKERVWEYPVAVSGEVLQGVKRLLLGLAQGGDEKRLIEEMKLVV
ncbi:MAG: hypothetical protein ABWK01_06420 [Infirmifilum sp.]